MHKGVVYILMHKGVPTDLYHVLRAAFYSQSEFHGFDVKHLYTFGFVTKRSRFRTIWRHIRLNLRNIQSMTMMKTSPSSRLPVLGMTYGETFQ